MVEPSFLVGLAVVFVLGLVFILRQSAATPDVNEKKKDKEKKPKGGKKVNKGPQKNSLKKEKRPVEVKEWSGVDNPQKEAQEMLEFLKGKDPAEIAKQLNQGKPKKKPQAKKAKAEDSASDDSANETVIEDGFSRIVKKPKGGKKEKKEKKEKNEKEEKKGAKVKLPKPFFKPPPPAEGEAKPEEEKRPKRERKPLTDKPSTEEGESSDKTKERRERPEGERKERPDGEKRERKERPDRPPRKILPSVAPIVKYEQADLTDILDSITQDFDKPKPKVNRVSSIFSKIPRNVVVSILSRVEARDLVALSGVNHYFSGVARKETLWKDVLLRDFGLKDMGKYRNFRLAYKTEFKKRKAAAKKQKREEEKATTVAVEVKEEPKSEEPAKEVKEPKQKKDNKKKKTEETATEAPAED